MFWKYTVNMAKYKRKSSNLTIYLLFPSLRKWGKLMKTSGIHYPSKTQKPTFASTLISNGWCKSIPIHQEWHFDTPECNFPLPYVINTNLLLHLIPRGRFENYFLDYLDSFHFLQKVHFTFWKALKTQLQCPSTQYKYNSGNQIKQMHELLLLFTY